MHPIKILKNMSGNTYDSTAVPTLDHDLFKGLLETDLSEYRHCITTEIELSNALGRTKEIEHAQSHRKFTVSNDVAVGTPFVLLYCQYWKTTSVGKGNKTFSLDWFAVSPEGGKLVAVSMVPYTFSFSLIARAGSLIGSNGLCSGQNGQAI